MRFISLGSRSAVLSVLGLTVAALLLSAAVIAQQPDHKEPGDEPSSKYYKNIKVLKDLPAKDMIPLMRKIDDSLGVKCGFCHTVAADHTGFEKDDKPAKTAARAMITMTNEMNKKFKVVEKKVTCFMCHRGKAEPERTASPK